MHIQAIPAFNDNYIWLIHSSQDNSVIVIDPGDAVPVMQTIKTQALELAAILITHHHADHTGGILQLIAAFDVPVYGPAKELVEGINKSVEDQQQFTVRPGFPLIKVMDTGGHTAGHISYLIQNTLFCGDTLFAGGCGRLLGGTAAQLFHSLQQIAKLPDDTEIFCAHEYTLANLKFALAVEPDNQMLQQRITETERLRRKSLPSVPSRLLTEKQTNPFLRCDEPNVINATSERVGHQLNEPLEVFIELRHWKDTFK